MPEHGTITFVPSVHFSTTHRRRAREAIRREQPDLVAVELDERRFERMERSARQDRFELARDLPPATAATYSSLKAIQETVARMYGLDPEQTDMDAAIDAAAEQGIDVALIDDPIERTISALSARVGLETFPKLLFRMGSLGPEAYADQMELLTIPFRDVESGDDVQPAIDHLRRLLPEVADVLIDRRDRAMARRLHALRRQGKDVVAIVGAGHHNGIRQHLAELERQDADQNADVPVRTPDRRVTRIPVT